jgi:hypothetical protein
MVYTGVPAAWLSTATYPVTIDPDYAGDASDVLIYGSGVYATARTTASVIEFANRDWLNIGMDGAIGACNVSRSFLKFNTSAITTANTVTQANLKFVCVTDWSVTDIDLVIQKCDWSAYDPPTNVNKNFPYNLCLSAVSDNIWRNTLGMSLNTQYTSANLSTSWISKTGFTYYGLISSEDIANSANTGNEGLTIASQDHATTGYRPVLTIISVPTSSLSNSMFMW